MEELVQAAARARKNAYVPYSGFAVGAAVRGQNGRIYWGCNVENASYGLSNCAERTAIFQAVAAGECQLLELAVIADTTEPVAPCGACRQVMAEFGIKNVIMANISGKRRISSLTQLLPYGFSKSDLKKEGND